MRISELEKIDGLDCGCFRDGEFDAIALLGRRKNESERHISFVGAMKYLPQVKEGGIECIICPPGIADEISNAYDGGIATADDPKTALFTIHEYLAGRREKTPSVISPFAKISDSAKISDMNVVIGENVVIEENVTVRPNTFIGDGSVIMANTVVGAPAFYYYGNGDGRKMVCSSGGVKIGKNVHIHSNTSVCRGVIGGFTEIRDNCAVAENVTISHDVILDEGTIIALGVQLGGWVQIGKDNFVGIGADIAPNVKTGKNVKISMGSVVTRDVPEETQVSGNYAIDHDLFISDLKDKLK
ncbi:MAG: DapH/DapD/GlmU-related protein [Anaerovoracaceae bacterium]|nr:DapH/DapD/GlmU-related protein [Anaerovoracaceae bacterium]